MLLAFTMRLMVRSAHLALSLIRFTAQFDFAVSDRYSYEKMQTASLGTARWADLSTRHHIRPRLKARAWCGDLCWDEPITPSQRCRMYIMSHQPMGSAYQIWLCFIIKDHTKFDSINVIQLAYYEHDYGMGALSTIIIVLHKKTDIPAKTWDIDSTR